MMYPKFTFGKRHWPYITVALLSSITVNAWGDFDGNIVLGSPTGVSIVANILTDTSQDIYLSYGTQSGNYPHRTASIALSADTPKEVLLSDLTPDTQYYYQLNYDEGGDQFIQHEELSFHTAREKGSSFVFGVQGDSHPERAPRDFIPELYTQTLNQAKQDGVDFYFTLGDDFSIDKRYPLGITEDDVRERYRIQRPWLGAVGKEAPVFLVNGNHEQGALYLYNDARNYPKPNNPAVWVQNARNDYFTQPEPNAFYTGNDEELAFIDKGLKGTYYAFEWGDALFVTLDPFWSSEAVVNGVFEGIKNDSAEQTDNGRPEDKWDISLGDKQYNWLKDTLESSNAKFKFVFAHLMHGGGRGGVELAHLYEWGGQNRRGNYEFDTERPNWDKPIHQLMADTGVTVFFHGHDHIWAKQELDGVIYQEVGSPADSDYEIPRWAESYTDKTTILRPNTGYTRVTVSPEQVQVDYIRAYLSKDENDERQTGEVSYSYVIK